MPLLDVSDLLDDPDFAAEPGTLFLLTRAQGVGENGRTRTTAARTPLEGVAMPASGAMLDLLPDGARASGAIAVYTRTKLSVQTERTAADRIEYLGALYTVSALSDFSPYGSGFCAAVCTLTDLTAQPV